MMKFLILIFFACIYLAKANAQENHNQLIMGTWEYKSPKGKNNLTYKFNVDNKFVGIMEHKEKEEQTEGSYELEKMGDLDRLKLTIVDKTNTARSHILYRFISFKGTDTLKLQPVNDRQSYWLKETAKNTLTFIRK